MAEDTTAPPEDLNASTEAVPTEVAVPAEDAAPSNSTSSDQAQPGAKDSETPDPNASKEGTPADSSQSETVTSENDIPTEVAEAAEPDVIQPYVDRVKENIQLALEDPDIGGFLRAHIKTFREEWDGWSETAKYTYTHMMTAQLLQRQAAATQIALGNQFKLPPRSAHAKLMASIKRAITKPSKRKPALSIPTKMRPTSSQK